LNKSIAFLINPHKKTRKIAEYIAWILAKLAGEQPLWEVYVYSEEWPLDFEGVDEIWVMGGDGTYHYFVNRYPDCTLPIALFKGGTGNDFYWKVFGDISREAHFSYVLAGKSADLDAGKVNHMLFLNGVGIGIEGEVLRSMDAIRYIGGAIGYYLAAIPNILRFKEYGLWFGKKTSEMSKSVFLCMVFNSARAGGGFHFFPMASVRDGRLDMMLCEPLPVIKRLFYMPKIQQGKHVNYSFLEFSQITSKTICCDRVLRAQVDGEVLEADVFDFKVLPAKFKFIVP
jgi:diacylglycerol kinase family enzyme